MLYWLLPDRLMTSQNADWRLLVPLCLLMVAAAESPEGKKRPLVAVGIASLILNLGAAVLADRAWRDSGRVVGNLQRVLEHLPEHAELVPYPTEAAIKAAFPPPAALHAAAYAVIARSAPVPTVFAHRGQQPIELAATGREGWQDWLTKGANRSPDASLLGASGRYVLAVRAGGETPGSETLPLPLPAMPISEAGRFTLYRLDR